MALMWACAPFVEPEDVLAADCGCPMEATDPIAEWIDMATDVLYHLSDGYVTGVCTRLVRPVTAVVDCLPPTLGPWAACCDPGPQLVLRGPDAVVNHLWIDGVELDPSEWALVDGERLIRRTGAWPTRNDIRQPHTEAGTWAIDVSFGWAPDYITRAATIEMTCELAKYAGIGSGIEFPPGVVSANVQGVSVTIEDVAQAIAEGRELMPKVDRFLSMYGGRRQQASVFSPETDTYRLVEVSFFS